MNMTPQSFIFGGSGGAPSYESLKKRREIADLLQRQATARPAQNMGEGIGQAGQMLASILMDKKLGPQEDAARQNAMQEIMRIQGGLGPEGITQDQFHGLGAITDNPYAPSGVNAIAQTLMRRQISDAGTPFSPNGGQMAFSGGQDGGNFGWTDPGEIPPDVMDEFNRAMEQFQNAPTDMNGEIMDRAKRGLEGRGIPIPQEANPWLQGGIPNGPMSGAGGGKLARTEATAGPMVAQADTGTATDASVRGDVKLTEQQSKDLGFWNRMDGVAPDIDKFEGALTQMGEKMKDGVPLIGNMLVSPEYQQGRRAASEWIVALLRKDTGAQVTKEEWGLYGPIYIPQPGDEAPTLEAKRAARKRAQDGLKAGLGIAEVLANELMAQRQQPAAPPAGGGSDDWRTKDPSTWTDEQLKEFTQ
jgi:hypothetical protein